MKNKIEILIGNIGAGKSTYCKEKVKEGYVVVSRDDIRYSIGAGRYIFNIEYELGIKCAVQELFKSFLEVPDGVNIIVDETNMTQAIREFYISTGAMHGYEIKAIVFHKLSKEESVKRRLCANHGNTSKAVWEEVWDRFDSIYEKPNKKEGFNEISYRRK